MVIYQPALLAAAAAVMALGALVALVALGALVALVALGALVAVVTATVATPATRAAATGWWCYTAGRDALLELLQFEIQMFHRFHLLSVLDLVPKGSVGRFRWPH